jgi:hypothetical protein
MTLTEAIALKFQSILGKQYKVMPYHGFSQKYTKAVNTPYGPMYDINYQAFDELAEIIPACVQVQELSLVSTPYTCKSCSYSVKFWAPLDYIKTDKDGQIVETPKFDLFGDCANLYSSLVGSEIPFYLEDLTITDYATSAGFPATGEADKIYRAANTGLYYIWSGTAYVRTGCKAYISMAEPQLLSTTPESSGAYKRLVWEVKGDISISDIALGTGNSIKVALVIDGVEDAFENISEFVLGATSDANAVQLSSTATSKQDTAVIGQQVTFYVQDYDTGAAFQLIRDKAWKNPEEISSTATLAKNKRKVFAKLYKDNTLMSSFWAVLSVQYTANDKASFGKYQVGLVNGGD